MNYFILPTEIPLLLLSMNLVTTLTFSSPISFIAIGSGETDVYLKKINPTTIALKSRSTDLKTNLVVTLKDTSFTFNLNYAKDPRYTQLNVYSAITPNSLLTNTLNTKELSIMRGQYSTKFICKRYLNIDNYPCSPETSLTLGTRPSYSINSPRSSSQGTSL